MRASAARRRAGRRPHEAAKLMECPSSDATALLPPLAAAASLRVTPNLGGRRAACAVPWQTLANNDGVPRNQPVRAPLPQLHSATVSERGEALRSSPLRLPWAGAGGSLLAEA